MDKNILNTTVLGTQADAKNQDGEIEQSPAKFLLNAAKFALQGMAGYVPEKSTTGVQILEGEELISSKKQSFINALLNVELQTIEAMAYLASMIYPDNYKKSGQSIEEYIDKNGLAILDLDLVDMYAHLSTELMAKSRYFVDLRRPNCRIKGVNLSNSIFHNSNLDKLKLDSVVLLEVDIVDVNLAGANFEVSPVVKSRLNRVNLTNSDFTKSAFSHNDLIDVNFSNSRLHRVNFRESEFSRVIMDSCIVTKSTFPETKINESSFRNSNLDGGEWDKSQIANSNFDGLICTNTSFHQVKFANCSLRHALVKESNWSLAQIEQSDLYRVIFSENTRVVRTVFRNCNLSGSIWRSVAYGTVYNKNPDFFEVELEYDNSEDLIVEGVRFLSCEMPNSDFSNEVILGMVTNGTNFENSNFKHVNLEEIQVKDTKFEGSNMKGVVIQESLLSNVNFRNVDLSNAKFSDCTLREIDFTGANLQGATFEHTQLWGAIMPDGSRYRDGCLEKFTGVRQEG